MNMRRTRIKKGLEPETIMIEFRCRGCGNVWSKERVVGNTEIDRNELVCPKCKSKAVSLVYPSFHY